MLASLYSIGLTSQDKKKRKNGEGKIRRAKIGDQALFPTTSLTKKRRKKNG